MAIRKSIRSARAPAITAGLPSAEFAELKSLWSLLTREERAQIRPELDLVLTRARAKEAAKDRGFRGFLSTAISGNGERLPEGPTRS